MHKQPVRHTSLYFSVHPCNQCATPVSLWHTTNQLWAPLNASYKCRSQRRHQPNHTNAEASEGTVWIIQQECNLEYFVHEAQCSIDCCSIYKKPVQWLEIQSIIWVWSPKFPTSFLLYPMQASASGLLASWLKQETLTQCTHIWFHDWSLNRAPSNTTYNTLAHGFKTIWVTALNQKAPTNLLTKKLNSCIQEWLRVSAHHTCQCRLVCLLP